MVTTRADQLLREDYNLQRDRTDCYNKTRARPDRLPPHLRLPPQTGGAALPPRHISARVWGVRPAAEGTVPRRMPQDS
jgi:hypothetical protein